MTATSDRYRFIRALDADLGQLVLQPRNSQPLVFLRVGTDRSVDCDNCRGAIPGGDPCYELANRGYFETQRICYPCVARLSGVEPETTDDETGV